MSSTERENQRVNRSECREQLSLSVSKSKPAAVSTENEREECNTSKVALLKNMNSTQLTMNKFKKPELFRLKIYLSFWIFVVPNDLR